MAEAQDTLYDHNILLHIHCHVRNTASAKYDLYISNKVLNAQYSAFWYMLYLQKSFTAKITNKHFNDECK